jgi:hypothetical protein
MAQKTAISFLNTQVLNLSTTVANQGAGAVTAEQFSSLSSFVSTLAYLDFTNLSTYTSSLTGQVNSNSTSIGNFTSGFDDFSTAQTAINDRLNGVSTYVSSFQLDVMSTSIQALQTFSTSQNTSNLRYDGVSTTLSTAVSTNTAQTNFISSLQTFSTIQVSTINQTLYGMSTTLSSAVSTNSAQNTAITNLQTFSTIQIATNTTFSTNIASLNNTVTAEVYSTNLFNYGQRRGQYYYGPHSDPGSPIPLGYGRSWGLNDGTSAQGTSTLMTDNNMRGVVIINNFSTQDVILPLYMGIATNGYNNTCNMVPSTIFDEMRFAHVGTPGSNSSITINLVSSGSATAAVTLSAGEVVTMIYKGGVGAAAAAGGPSSPSNYFYLTSL